LAVTISKKALAVFDYALENNLAGTSGELCQRIGLLPSNLSAIRKGMRTFTHEQLYELAKLTRCNMNYIYGFSTDMFRSETNDTPLARIRQALTELEANYKAKKK